MLSKYKVPFLIYQLIHAFACYSFIVFISSFIFTYTGWLVYWISNEDLSIFRTACEQAYCLFEATHGFNSKMWQNTEDDQSEYLIYIVLVFIFIVQRSLLFVQTTQFRVGEHHVDRKVHQSRKLCNTCHYIDRTRL